MGASSDHLILDVKGQSLKVGAEVRFDVGYSALLRAMMSPYVEKMYLPRLRLTARGSSLSLLSTRLCSAPISPLTS